MKILRRLLFPTIALLAGIILSTLTASAATVTFRIRDMEAKSGGTVEIPIDATGASGLSAVHLEVTYDEKVVTPDTVTRGPLAGNNALVDFNGAKPGRLLIGIATLDAIKGDGSLVFVRFKIVGEGGTSTALSLDNSRAWESGAHAEVLVKTEAGKVSVTSEFPFFILAVVAIALAILVSIILLVALLRRRSRASRALPVQGRSVPPPPGKSSDAFRKAETEYFRLKARLSAGQITQQQFEAAMEKLTIQDSRGRYWTIDRNTGRWLLYNGQTWIEGKPY